MINKVDFLESIKLRANSQLSVKPITSLCFPTRNRVSSLKRAIESYIENSLKHERKVRFVVSDDSENPEISKQYRNMLRSLKEHFKIEISYAGFLEKEQFICLLENEGLPSEMVRFALSDAEKVGSTYGLNRNALLLETLGENILMADDDTMCRLTDAPGRGKALTISSGHDPTEFCFYPDRETLMAVVPFLDADFCGVHEKLLGKDIGRCLLEHSDGVNVETASESFLNSLMSRGGHVITTMTGIAGDSGMGSPLYYLSLNGISRQRLLRSEVDFEAALSSRQVLRKVNFPVITDSPFYMTTTVGLDNRELLPPFIPVQRNGDALFGMLLRKSIENGYFGYLPWAVFHQPIEERKNELQALYSPSHLYLTDILIHLVRVFQFLSFSGLSERLKELGKYLIHLGALELKEFEGTVLPLILNIRNEYIAHMEKMLLAYGETPDYWAKHVRMRIRTLRDSLASKDFVIPFGLKRGAQPDELRKLNQRLVQKFGQLLFWWPEMIETARSLKEQGSTLAEAL